ncbi:MAG TPA: hypothetical protein VFW33_13090 [Gemmataceae bacterium]|nr:hypothetical protein [Gemmataceae bacterium]
MMPAPGVHYPHRIRLRDPWQSAPSAGGARRSRRFGYPGRIDADERVWLTFGGAGGRVSVSLNGHALGTHDAGAPFEHDVTGLLAARNEVVLEIEGGGAQGDVALEVRRTAFLRGVRVTVEGGRLRVAGSVVGSAARPLEVYVLLDGRTVHYATVEASEEGRAFEALAEGSGRSVRVELVDGATVWYAVELPVL